jgi:uncharacterized protein (DUF2147 family)
MNTLFKKSAFSIVAFLLFSVVGFSQTENKIIDTWQAEEDASKKMEIYLAKDGLFYSKDSTGKLILKKLKYNEKTKSYSGQITPPEKDMTLNVTISFESDNKLKMLAKKFIMSKTLYLIKIK